ncbi:hypothetical protein P691DRAFT_764025 [Macrolepiota fuliginosa MF-IS2]|uniref:Uncharacterized protein n=1 Tax=Macrolepiota fuliginosa MF-IS2 TaxID=1400762 RepID=A0A9P6BZL9_9AGAR|nr:hypothetical protein P691DRAFT_764025 [Macrolepiota fuliginosa MF-IS2]
MSCRLDVDQYSQDKFFKLVLNDPTAYKNFEVSNGLIFLRLNGKHTLCIPDILING